MERARIQTPLKTLLENEGRTQTWLASKIGVDSRQVWGWVHGLHLPEDGTRQAIADALGRQVEDLWPETERSAA